MKDEWLAVYSLTYSAIHDAMQKAKTQKAKNVINIFNESIYKRLEKKSQRITSEYLKNFQDFIKASEHPLKVAAGKTDKKIISKMTKIIVKNIDMVQE
jgi:hypothetical protein